MPDPSGLLVSPLTYSGATDPANRWVSALLGCESSTDLSLLRSVAPKSESTFVRCSTQLLAKGWSALLTKKRDFLTALFTNHSSEFAPYADLHSRLHSGCSLGAGHS